MSVLSVCVPWVSSPRLLQRPEKGAVGGSSSTEVCDGGGGTLWGDNELLYINTNYTCRAPSAREW